MRTASIANDAVITASYGNYVIGRWQQFAKSGFARDPAVQWPAQSAILLGK